MTVFEFVSAWRDFPRQWLLGLDIPQRTVDDYRAGKAPVEWSRSRIIAALQAELKKHNKTQKPTTTARQSKGKDGA